MIVVMRVSKLDLQAYSLTPTGHLATLGALRMKDSRARWIGVISCRAWALYVVLYASTIPSHTRHL